MKEYLNWVVEKFVSENFSCPEGHLSFMLYDDIQELVLRYPDIISEKYSPEAYFKEREVEE